ncbi:MAG: RNase adapter RapZ [Deltaproteobacteria bacterium]|nr:RNase adapter RapZ [Deltaproteobacteria bacterium]
MRAVVLSGPSGSGKSTAIKALEDLGYYCVDNMPVALLPKFMELLATSGEIARVAAVIDVRERSFLKDFVQVFSELKATGYHMELIYLEASDDALVRRFSETRRRHPLAAEESPMEGLMRERELLKDLKSLADRVVDTTEFNVHELRDMIKEFYSGPVTREKMALNFISFGYRYGLPTDADLVIDVRFLPNPYFVNALKRHDGLEKPVKDYILAKDEAKEFLERFRSFLGYLIPLYWKEGKSYLTIAVGCTGGKHRSVAMVEEIADGFKSDMVSIRKRHRDIAKS